MTCDIYGNFNSWRFTFEFRVHLWVTTCDLWVKSYDLCVKTCDLWLMTCDLWDVISDQQFCPIYHIMTYYLHRSFSVCYVVKSPKIAPLDYETHQYSLPLFSNKNPACGGNANLLYPKSVKGHYYIQKHYRVMTLN